MPDASDIKKVQHMFIYFSKIIDKEVVDKADEFVGKLYDIVLKPTEVYPMSSRLIIKKGFLNPRYASLGWEHIAECEEGYIKLKVDKSAVKYAPFSNNKEEFTLRRDILDQQVVDTYNHNVIRVNDAHLLRVENNLMIAHVDIGSRGIVRRLGWEGFVDFIVRLVNKNAKYLKNEILISWKYIQPLSINPVSKTIKVNIPEKQIRSIPAADFGEIMTDLDHKQRLALFRAVDLEVRAKALSNMDFQNQKFIIDELSPTEAAEVLAKMPSDEATDLLEKLPPGNIEKLLGLMETKASRKLSNLLGYSSDSAGGLMTTEYIALPENITAEEALKKIEESPFGVETIQYVYIINEKGNLMGSVNMKRLISADPKSEILKLIFPKTIYVNIDASVKEVAYFMDKYKCHAIPVVDKNGILCGIITIDDILSQVISLAWGRLKRRKIKRKN